MKSHVLATKINGVLHDNKFDRYVGGRTRGDLDFGSLSKIGYSNKVFKKKEARLNKDYKVIVLADCSGSMWDSGAGQACGEAFQFLNDALGKTDVEYALWSFNADAICVKDFKESDSKKIRELYYEHKNRFLVDCQTCNTVYGTFDPQVEGKPCQACGVIFNDGDESTDWEGNYHIDYSAGYTADGLALHLATEVIEPLSGKHIIVMLSDGGADSIGGLRYKTYQTRDGIKYEDMKLKKVVDKLLQNEDVILCSIGIQSDNVLQHYPKQNTVVIQRVDQIGHALVGLIGKHVRRG